ncbi:MAG: DUF1775 domain-containing protein [Vicinamibacterales bacterium]
MKRVLAAICALPLLGAVLSAHIMVSPPQSKAGATQAYELRVHNEGKQATTSLELQIPSDVTVLKVDTPATGKVDTPKSGDRITAIVWTVNVEPTKYVALKFEAKNPSTAKDVTWVVRQHLADGSVIEWSDKPGAKEKASVTTIAAATN